MEVGSLAASSKSPILCPTMADRQKREPLAYL